MKPRSEIASEEITSNPIFLLQRRMVIPNQESLADYDSEGECLVHPDTKEPMDDDALLEHGWGFVYYITEKVFSTRKEGGEYGEANKHNLGEGRKGTDWRVYCIPCEGELAQILAVRPEILEFALNMERTMQRIAKTNNGRNIDSWYVREWKRIPITMTEGCIGEAIDNLLQAFCIQPHDTESVVRLSTELAMYCMMEAHRAANWKCPICGEGSINGMAVEHKDGCDYCEEKIKRMLKKDATDARKEATKQDKEKKTKYLRFGYTSKPRKKQVDK